MDGDKDGYVAFFDVVKNLRSEKQAADLRTLTDIPELFWLNLSDDDCIEIFKKVGFDPDTLIKGEKKFTVKEWRAFLANAKQLIGLEEQERILESLEPPPPPPVIDPRLEIAWELFDNGDWVPIVDGMVVEQAYEDGRVKVEAHTAKTFLNVDFRSMEATVGRAGTRHKVNKDTIE